MLVRGEILHKIGIASPVAGRYSLGSQPVFPVMPHRVLHLSCLVATALLFPSGTVRSDEVWPTEIVSSIRMSCLGEPGKTYRVLGSPQLSGWQQLGGPRQFGSGAPVSMTCPIGVGPRNFRYAIDTLPPGGLAPWTATGRQWVLNVQGHPLIYRFLTPTSGNVSELPGGSPTVAFTYTALRPAEDLLRLTLNLPAGVVRTIESTFLTATLGEFSSTDVLTGVTVDSATGVFADAQPPPPSPSPVLVPSSLNARTLVLRDAAVHSLANFTSASIGTETHRGITAAFTASYSTLNYQDAQVSLQVPGRSDAYHLKFTSRQTGTFTRQRALPGLPVRSDSGVFILENTP